MDLPRITVGQKMALDFETTGLKYWEPDFKVIGAGICLEPGHSFYLNFLENPGYAQWVLDTIPKVYWVNHRISFDLHAARTLGLKKMPLGFTCTMIAEALLDEHRLVYNLDSISKERLGRGKLTLPPGPISEADPALLAAYAANDAELAWLVDDSQYPELEEQDLLRVMSIEMALLPILNRMEHTGVRVDLEKAHASIPQLTKMIDALQKELNEVAGWEFNVNSVPQVRKLFQPTSVSKWQFQLIDGTLCETTKTGGPCIDQHVLKDMAHPGAKLIRRLRKLIKCRDTFLSGHIIGHADANGYVHPTIHQTKSESEAGTGTGRLSITDPALQQITSRDSDTADIVRSCFLPDKDQMWYATDYSQVDARMCVHLIRDPRLNKQYHDDPSTDFHQAVSDMTGIPRNSAYAGAPNTKTMNLSLQFGAGPGKIARSMGMPYTVSEGSKGRMYLIPGPEAEAIFKTYHHRFPYIGKFAKEARDVAKAQGYVRTKIGRRLRFPKKDFHKAAGLLYQAYAADQHKIGIIRVAQALKGTNARLMLPIHDELGISMSKNPELERSITEAYCHNELNLRIPITASSGYGVNWRDATRK